MKTNSKGVHVVLLLLMGLLIQCNAPEPKSSSKSINNPIIDGIAGATSVFDAATSTYTLTIPPGTDLTAIKFVFTLPVGATSKPNSGSIQDFTNPVTYTITAEDGSTQTFTVKAVHKSTWATVQERYDAIRLKAQKVASTTVSTATPSGFSDNATITDADVDYIANKGVFVKNYMDTKATVWQAIDKVKLEVYYVSITVATGELRVDKGINVGLDQNGTLKSYKPSWALFYKK